jgi:hypothetical protein
MIVINHQISQSDLLAMANGESVQIDENIILTLDQTCYVNAAFLGQPVIDPRGIYETRFAMSRALISNFLFSEICEVELREEFMKLFPLS